MRHQTPTMLSQLILVLGLIHATFAIDCSVKELEKYDLELIRGINSVTFLKDTPPTQTNVTWYFGICESIDGVDQCPKNSDICGITKINLEKDSKKSVVSEIIGFNSNLQKTYHPMEDDKGIKISYTGANWGDNLIDAELIFNCDKDGNGEFKLEQWDDKKLIASVNSKAGCITSKDDKTKPPPKEKKPKPDDGESWGWFTWIFIFMVLFLSIYIIGGAWFQYNKGNSIDFQSALSEVLENFLDLLRGLPHFIREIIEKVTGNSNRGEYSAV